jgi:glutamate racemase
VDEHDVKMVIVACNTAEAAAFHELRAATDVPVLGVIDPGVRALVSATTSGRVGVIGTVGTISSGAYQRAVEATGAPVKLTCAACPGFVEFVERGETNTDQVHVLAERLLAPVIDAGVDTLLLGCTHYPYLARTLADVLGREVVLVSSADETAFAVRAVFDGHPAAAELPAVDRRGAGRPARHRFLSSGDVAWFRELGGRLLGPELADAEAVTWAPSPPGSPAA